MLIPTPSNKSTAPQREYDQENGYREIKSFKDAQKPRDISGLFLVRAVAIPPEKFSSKANWFYPSDSKSAI
jgi:hypothetical protein